MAVSLPEPGWLQSSPGTGCDNTQTSRSPGLLGVCGCSTALKEEAGSLGWKAVGGGYPASIIGTSDDIQQSKSFGLKVGETGSNFSCCWLLELAWTK